MSEFRLVIDLDGTICEQTVGGDEYWKAKPIHRIIDRMNRLYMMGWHVTIHTARGMHTYHYDFKQIEEKLREKTEKWLFDNAVHYDLLIFGKPPATMYVDDKGMTLDEFAAGCF